VHHIRERKTVMPHEHHAHLSHEHHAPKGYSFTTLDVPGAGFPGFTTPLDVNDRGQVVGEYFTGADVGVDHGFLYDAGSYTTIDVPGATGTGAAAINDKGEIVGSTFPSHGVENGFIYDSGNFTILAVPGATSTLADDINNRGQVVGTYSNGSPGELSYLYDNATYTTIDVPGSTFTFATSINDQGEVAGNYSDSNGGHGFVYENGTFTTIDVSGATGTGAAAIEFRLRQGRGRTRRTILSTSRARLFLRGRRRPYRSSPEALAALIRGPAPRMGFLPSSDTFGSIR
jgi:uncharacterized membrane protein